MSQDVEIYSQALPSEAESGHDVCMAGVPSSHRFRFASVDSWLSVVQWVWDRGYAFIASTAGAALLGYLANATSWMAKFGPIAWGAAALAAFSIIYSLLIWGRHRLATARRERATAMIAERVAEHVKVNPLAEDFRNQRVRLVDLYTPTGNFLMDRTFRRCDLIGPAVLWISPHTTFARNMIDGVEFIRVNAKTAQMWPNKLALARGSIEDCHLFNVIILVDDNDAAAFQSMWTSPIQWMNDPIPQSGAPISPSPPGT